MNSMGKVYRCVMCGKEGVAFVSGDKLEPWETPSGPRFCHCSDCADFNTRDGMKAHCRSCLVEKGYVW